MQNDHKNTSRAITSTQQGTTACANGEDSDQPAHNVQADQTLPCFPQKSMVPKEALKQKPGLIRMHRAQAYLGLHS